MTESEKIQAEKNELNVLINRGVNIEVERIIKVQSGKRFLFFKKYETKTEKLKFTIKEPTLSTLDRLAAEQIELTIDEAKITEQGISEAKRLANEQSKRMAKIVAIAVLGQDYILSTQQGSRIKYENDEKALNELTELFFHNIKPSTLFQYVILINSMSNLADFTNSIRLMSASRTTMPNLIEGKQKA